MYYDPTKGFTFTVLHLEDSGAYECIVKEFPEDHLVIFDVNVHESCEFDSNCSVSINQQHFNTTDRPNFIASSTAFFGINDAEETEAYALDTTEANKLYLGAGFSFAGVFNNIKMVMVN